MADEIRSFLWPHVITRGGGGCSRTIGDVVEIAPSHDSANGITSLMAGRLIVRTAGAHAPARRAVDGDDQPPDADEPAGERDDVPKHTGPPPSRLLPFPSAVSRLSQNCSRTAAQPTSARAVAAASRVRGRMSEIRPVRRPIGRRSTACAGAAHAAHPRAPRASPAGWISPSGRPARGVHRLPTVRGARSRPPPTW